MTIHCLLCRDEAACISDCSIRGIAYDPKIIRIPDAEALRRPPTIQRLALVYRSLGLSRRSVLNFLAEAIHVRFADGFILSEYGEVIDQNDIDLDRIFNTDLDPSERWLGDLLIAARKTPKQRVQWRVLDRLRVLWLAIAITDRRLAEAIITR